MKPGLLLLLLLVLNRVAVGQTEPHIKGMETLVYSGKLSRPLAFSPDGRWLACGSGDQDMVVWDLQRRRVVHRLHPATIFHYSVAFSPDSRTMATGGHDEHVRLWDVATGKLQKTLKGVEGGNRVYRVAYTPDGRTVAAACYHGILEMWDSRSGKLNRIIKVDWRASDLSIASNGRTIAVADSASNSRPPDFIDLYDMHTGHHLKNLSATQPVPTYGDTAWCIAYSPYGKLIASGSQQTLRLWNVQTGRLQKTLEWHKNQDHEVMWLSFLPDGKRLISASSDGNVSLWSIPSGRRIRVMKMSKEWDGYALAPNGRTLAYAINGVVRLCNLQTLIHSKPMQQAHK